MKRFSKIVSSSTLSPSARHISAIICACRSVAKPGKGAVVTSTARIGPPFRDARRPAPVSSIATPRRLQLIREGRDQVAPPAEELHLAATDRGGDHVGPELDPVGDHGMGAAMQSLDPFHGDRGGSRPLDPRAHRGQAAREIHRVGFLRPRFGSQSSRAPASPQSRSFSVAPTVTKGKSISAPVRPFGAVAWT